MKSVILTVTSGDDWYWVALSENDAAAIAINADGEHRNVSITDENKAALVSAWKAGVDGIRTKAPALWDTVHQGQKADMPVAGQPGGEERFYIATDAGEWYRDVGYVFADSDAEGGLEYAWEDIIGTGDGMTPTDRVKTVNIGFDFPFLGGQVVDEVHIGSNGLLSIGSDSEGIDSSNEEIPTSAVPNNIICPFWDDFTPSSEGKVHHQVKGTEPDRRFIVQYTRVKLSETSDHLTFQAILHEDGRIKFQYKEMPGAGDGSSATIGIEGKDGATGVEVSHDTAYIHDEMAVLLEPKWELMFGSDALADQSSQRSLQTESQKAALGDHNHDRPAAPANLTAEGRDGQIVLTWENPNNSSITSYEYVIHYQGDPVWTPRGPKGNGESPYIAYWDPAGDNWKSVPGNGPNMVTYTVTGLGNDRTYDVLVRAVNSYADGNGAGQAAAAMVLVENQPPVADAGESQTVNKENTVTLRGSGKDEYPDDLTYSWSLSDPNLESLVPITDPASAVATFTAPVWIANLRFVLTVKDRQGSSHKATTTVEIINRPPTVSAGEDRNVGVGDRVALEGSASDPDRGDTLTYFWFQQVGATVDLTDSNVPDPTFTAPTEPGTLVFGLFVVDGSGGQAIDYVTITVEQEQKPVKPWEFPQVPVQGS